ncbi:MAG: MarR family transcriptional regulator [Anaerolineales bacterium]|jgi:DNA-binding MarR family transcriptional regulator
MDNFSDVVAREILDIVPIIMRVIRSEMRNHRSADLAIPQFRALLFINRNPGSSLQTLATHLGLTPPTVSKMVDGLVLNRLVRRADSPRDRRMVTLTLTAQGGTILEKARNGTQAKLIEVLSRLTPEEGETVSQAMKLLHALFMPGTPHPLKILEGMQS